MDREAGTGTNQRGGPESGSSEIVGRSVALVARNVDQVVTSLAVSIDVAGVDERVPVAPIAREPVSLRYLGEDTLAHRFVPFQPAAREHHAPGLERVAIAAHPEKKSFAVLADDERAPVRAARAPRR